jgi:hypothetical protein
MPGGLFFHHAYRIDNRSPSIDTSGARMQALTGVVVGFIPLATVMNPT